MFSAYHLPWQPIGLCHTLQYGVSLPTPLSTTHTSNVIMTNQNNRHHSMHNIYIFSQVIISEVFIFILQYCIELNSHIYRQNQKNSMLFRLVLDWVCHFQPIRYTDFFCCKPIPIRHGYASWVHVIERNWNIKASTAIAIGRPPQMKKRQWTSCWWRTHLTGRLK